MKKLEFHNKCTNTKTSILFSDDCWLEIEQCFKDYINEVTLAPEEARVLCDFLNVVYLNKATGFALYELLKGEFEK